MKYVADTLHGFVKCTVREQVRLVEVQRACPRTQRRFMSSDTLH